MGRRLFLILVVLFCGWSANAESSTPRVTVRLPGLPADLSATVHVAEVKPSNPEELGGWSVESEHGMAVLDLPAGRSWRLEGQAEGYWSPELFVTPTGAPIQVTLELIPAGTVVVPLEVGRGEAPPGRGRLAFEPVATARSSAEMGPEGEIECIVHDGVARCPGVPVGRHDLRWSAPGWVPLYRWAVDVRPERATRLDPFRLERGASVFGTVVSRELTELPAGIEVELEPARLTEVFDPAQKRRLQQARLTTTPDTRGTFQLGPVPPGAYRLRVTHPDLAPVERWPIEVHPDLEARLVEEILVAPPLSVEILVDPVTDPYGLPWKVFVRKEAENGVFESVEGTPDEEMLGLFLVDQLAPGEYRIEVRPTGSESRPGREAWVVRTVDLDATPGSPVFVEVPLHEVEGIVTRGDQPVTGRLLWIGPEADEPSPRIFVDLDRDGEFSGYLTSPGVWALRWISDSGEDELNLSPVEIEDESHQKVAIVIPDTRLAGEVVDEAGQPVPGAELDVSRVDRREVSMDHRADEDGRFVIEGLEPGPYRLRAQSAGDESDRVRVELSEDLEAPELRLVLRAKNRIEGRVSAAGSPIAGARVMGWLDFGATGGAGVARAVSDVAGRFSLQLPTHRAGLTVVVQAPGYGNRIQRVSADPGRSLELELEPISGTLVLDWRPQDMGSGRPVPLLARDGALVPAPFLMNLLQGDARVEGGELVISGMAIGQYALCAGEGSFVAMGAGGAPPAAECTGGHLGPHGQLGLAPLLE